MNPHFDSAIEEMPGERRDIVDPFAQRWEGHGDHREPVVEILAKRAFLDCAAYVFIRGRDETDIGAYRLRSAHTIEGLILKDSQQAALQGERHVSNFIEKYGSTFCHFDLAWLPFDRSGE